MKPILFNTEMVKAIMTGRKTVTRRLIKPQPNENAEMRYVYAGGRKGDIGKWHDWQQGVTDAPKWNPPYHADDILYVRETWRVQAAHRFEADARIEFMAGGPMTTIQFPGRCSDSHERPTYDDFICKWGVDGKWRPSIHMPKEAARIFLRVKSVRVDRLQDITEEDAKNEGIKMVTEWPDSGCFDYKEKHEDGRVWSTARECFRWGLWNSTVKPADLPIYGWEANPYVWTIEFEKISKEEALKC